jgi:hypothetical protein
VICCSLNRIYIKELRRYAAAAGGISSVLYSPVDLVVIQQQKLGLNSPMVGGLYQSNPVGPQLETARCQPLSLPLDPSRKTGFIKFCFFSNSPACTALRLGHDPGHHVEPRRRGAHARVLRLRRARGEEGVAVFGVCVWNYRTNIFCYLAQRRLHSWARLSSLPLTQLPLPLPLAGVRLFLLIMITDRHHRDTLAVFGFGVL